MKWYQRLFRGAKKEARQKVKDTLSSRELQQRVRKEVIKAINSKLDLPLVNEKTEAVLIGIIYDLLSGVVSDYVEERL